MKNCLPGITGMKTKSLTGFGTLPEDTGTGSKAFLARTIVGVDNHRQVRSPKFRMGRSGIGLGSRKLGRPNQKSVWLPEIWGGPIRNRFGFPKIGRNQSEIGLASRKLGGTNRKPVWPPEIWAEPIRTRFSPLKIGMDQSETGLAS